MMLHETVKKRGAWKSGILSVAFSCKPWYISISLVLVLFVWKMLTMMLMLAQKWNFLVPFNLIFRFGYQAFNTKGGCFVCVWSFGLCGNKEMEGCLRTMVQNCGISQAKEPIRYRYRSRLSVRCACRDVIFFSPKKSAKIFKKSRKLKNAGKQCLF